MVYRKAGYLACIASLAGCYLTSGDVLEQNRLLRDENMRLRGTVEAYKKANHDWKAVHDSTVAAIGSRLEAIERRERVSFGAQAERFFERFLRGERKSGEKKEEF